MNSLLIAPLLAFAVLGSAPSPSVAPGCRYPNVEVNVTRAQQPSYPASAARLRLGPVTTELEVTVDSSGHVVKASVYKSSGNQAIDSSALDAARRSSYSPKLVNCQPVEGRYLFRADFQPDTPSPDCTADMSVVETFRQAVERANKLVPLGQLRDASTGFESARDKVRAAHMASCETAGFYNRLATLNEAIAVFLGAMSLDAHDDSLKKCGPMHLASARYYAAFGWTNVFLASRFAAPSPAPAAEDANVYRDVSALARRVGVPLPSLKISETEAKSFLERFKAYDITGCDLRFQPEENRFI